MRRPASAWRCWAAVRLAQRCGRPPAGSHDPLTPRWMAIAAACEVPTVPTTDQRNYPLATTVIATFQRKSMWRRSPETRHAARAHCSHPRAIAILTNRMDVNHEASLQSDGPLVCCVDRRLRQPWRRHPQGACRPVVVAGCPTVLLCQLSVIVLCARKRRRWKSPEHRDHPRDDADHARTRFANSFATSKRGCNA